MQKTFDATRNWTSITSSSDGTKLAAVVWGGYIYTSIDSGNTWVQKTSDATRNWQSITSSADGTKLAAVVRGGYIYTSTDSGNTWVQKTPDIARYWTSIASSADGTRLAVVDWNNGGGGYIYTSVDSGNAWIQNISAGARNWQSITSSVDGTKLAAVVYGGYIYTSTDAGDTWVQMTSDATRNWRSITSSADGTKLAAVVFGDYIYSSTDSGNTWVQKTSNATRNWYSITSDASGTKLAAGVYGSYIYTSTPLNPQFSVDILSPTASTSVSIWSPYVSWGTAVECYYSYDKFVSTSTAVCANNGSDISHPSSLGTSTLSVKGIDAQGTTVTKQSTFRYDLGVAIIAPVGLVNTWSPNINWNVNNVATDTLTCYYSYNNFVSTSTAVCENRGSDIVAPAEGNSTLYVKVVDQNSSVGVSSVAFSLTSWVQKTSDTTRAWRSITSSADGTKLAAVVFQGYIYTSTDSGNTWVQKTSDTTRAWSSITSSADGTKLAAVVGGAGGWYGYIYTSTDSGNTWVQKTYDSARAWRTITSSADGTKLAAVVGGGSNTGYIYTSIDSGNTWVQKTSDAVRSWQSITSSADGTKLAAVVGGYIQTGYIYTSANSGNTWVARTSSGVRKWSSITSDASGTKLAAVVDGGYIYTSIDTGVTWLQKTSDATRAWNSITSSADGTKLAAVVTSGYVYTSMDSGNTWVQKASDIARPWVYINSSASGTKLASVVNGGYIYTSASFNPQLSVDILSPLASTSLSIWSPYVSWGTSVSCYYSYDNFISTSTANCANNGLDIVRPSPLIGTSTLSVKGIDAQGTTVTKQSTFRYDLGVAIIAPVGLVNTWSPNINWNVNNVATDTLTCYYSYDNFVSSSTVVCANGGTDIPIPAEGTYTLYVKVIDQGGNVGISSIPFTLSFWIQKTFDVTRSWQSITSSADGTKLAAVVYNGYIYTSVDSGATWVQKTSDATRNWQSITSSADGTKLAAVVNGGYIYTSTDSGNTWVQKTSDETRSWYSITSSADGTKLATVGGGYIYTSIDSGNTWVQKTSDVARSWRSITSSADGTKLAALANNGYIYTSADSGNTWVQKTSDATRTWNFITSSADGPKLAAVVWGGYIYTSTDFGSTWVQKTSDATRYWSSITSSADGTKLAAVVGGGSNTGYIYTSIDSGNTWLQKTSDAVRKWSSITYDASGTKLAAVVYDGYIYTYASSSLQFNLDILAPVASSTIYIWSPYVSWGTATQCYYSYDNFQSTSTANCALLGTDISKPSPIFGTSTLSVTGIDAQGVIITKQSTFRYDLGVFIISPAGTINTWSSNVNWNVNNVATSTLSCYYSYDNFVSTSTANCANRGADIVAYSTAEGSYILYVKVIDQNNNVGMSSSAFSLTASWIVRPPLSFTWISIASDASGTKLAAVVGAFSFVGYVYTSIDSGVTWAAKATDVQRKWTYVASSADGTKLAATTGGYGSSGYIYTSADSGNTWVQQTSSGSRGWYSIASSADGTKLAAVVRGGYIYTSIDSGVTWVQKTSGTARYWQSIASSADGTKLAAAETSGYIYTSIDSGNTWVQKTFDTARQWSSITSSADGTKLAAVGGSTYIYTSTDSGNTWLQKTSDSTRSWVSIISSADGTKLAAVVSNGYIYTSTDSGNTWVQKTFDTARQWSSITSSADGTKLAALVGGNGYFGYIYTSASSSPQLSIDILTPVSSSSISNWSPIVSWGTAVSCYYSYDNFVSTSTANCSLLGSDIPAASYGTSTLSVRGMDVNGVVATNQSTFFFPYYVWCGDVVEDNNWSNPNNWYTSPTCSVPANAVPNSGIYAALIGSTAPVVNTNTWTLPANIDSTGLTGGANTTGVIFTGTSTNSVYVTGNATFDGSTTNNAIINGNANFIGASHNTGTITGSATFNTSYFTGAFGGTLTIPSGSSWSGTVSGTVYGSDGSPITNYVFNGDASNLSTINGVASFNNTSPFTIGTVNGTVTLNGFSQILSGVNNVTNFFKQLVSGVRDTLYFTSGSTLNISGATTILGSDASNLLTIRTTSPNSSANIGINGSSTLNYLRIKDIYNIGPTVDVTTKNVFDDGGNSGFTFAPNTNVSTRSGVTSTYVPPYVAPVTPPTGGDDTTDGGKTTKDKSKSGGSSSGSFFKKLGKVDLDKLSLANLPSVTFSGLSSGSSLGTSNFINPLAGLLQLQPVTGFSPLPRVSWLEGISKFLNSSLPQSLVTLGNSVPSIKKELTIAGIKNGYDLYTMKESPINTPTLGELAKDKTKQPTNLIFVSVDNKETPTKLSIDKKGRAYQILTVVPNSTIDINVKSTDKTLPKTIFDNNSLEASKDKNNTIKLSLNAPAKDGERILMVGDLTLEIRVVKPEASAQPKVEKKLSPIIKLWSWFGK